MSLRWLAVVFDGLRMLYEIGRRCGRKERLSGALYPAKAVGGLRRLAECLPTAVGVANQSNDVRSSVYLAMAVGGLRRLAVALLCLLVVLDGL